MSNYLEHGDRIAFHPGYYIKEIIEESGLTQEDFAKRLDTTPKNLSLLVRGEQSLSIDIAMKLSRMLGTSIEYWLNLQSAYDSLVAQFRSEEELAEERSVFDKLGYKYFHVYFGLPDLPRKTDKQIEAVRSFLQVSTLCVLKNRDMTVSFRSATADISEVNTIKANMMVQVAMNEALKIEAPKFNRDIFEKAAEYALTLTENHASFYPLLREEFMKAGVILVILPNIEGSKINGATKKIGKKVMLMVNDRRLYSDTFWFTLFHEIGHVVNGDYGISFEDESGECEAMANRYAEDKLIPREDYLDFVAGRHFDVTSIRMFAKRIHRDPGIVLGRLENDGLVRYDDMTLKPLKHQYRVKTA